MTAIFRDWEKESPAPDQSCWITGAQDGLVSQAILGPAIYKVGKNGTGMFVDILHSSEAGAIWTKESGVRYWLPEEEIQFGSE